MLETLHDSIYFASAQTTTDLIVCKGRKLRFDRNDLEIAHSICATKTKQSDNDISMKLETFFNVKIKSYSPDFESVIQYMRHYQ